MGLSAIERHRKKLLHAYLYTTVSMVRADSPDLTDRQKAVFWRVYLDDEPQTVRGLAAYCRISKPAITRALDRLAEYDLIRRKDDPQDRRSIHVQRTAQGMGYKRKFEELIIRANQNEGEFQDE